MKTEPFDIGTVVHSKFDTSQVFSVAHYWLPEDKQFSESDANKKVACVENELKATGIYSEIKTYLFETIKENSRGLEIQVEYPDEFERFVISDIYLEGFPEIEPAKFQAALDVRGVELIIPFLKYKFDKLEDKIFSAFREAYPKYLRQKDYGSKLWILVRLSGDKQVRLVVSPTSPEC
jgi:hypothetical protein